jgi:hypothetical protein
MMAAGCSSSSDNPPDVTPTNPTTGRPAGSQHAPRPRRPTAALFQPAQGIFPFPNDLYFAGTTDGTINIQPANGLIPNQVGLNALDGWSTTAPIRIRFGGALNPASFSAATIRVYQVTVSNTTKAGLWLHAPPDLRHRVHRSAGHGYRRRPDDPRDQARGSAAAFAGPATPTSPLPEGTGYLVLLTNGIQMAGGQAADFGRRLHDDQDHAGRDHQPGELRDAHRLADARSPAASRPRTCWSPPTRRWDRWR